MRPFWESQVYSFSNTNKKTVFCIYDQSGKGVTFPQVDKLEFADPHSPECILKVTVGGDTMPLPSLKKKFEDEGVVFPEHVVWHDGHDNIDDAPPVGNQPVPKAKAKAVPRTPKGVNPLLQIRRRSSITPKLAPSGFQNDTQSDTKSIKYPSLI